MNNIISQATSQVAPVDKSWVEAALEKQQTLTKPPGSLGDLEDIASRVAAIQEKLNPGSMRKRIYVIAGDHGVAEEGVSAYPSVVTQQMVTNFLRGGAAINVLGRHGDIEISVVDVGVASDLIQDVGLITKRIVHGTENFTRGPAMSRENAEESIVTGIELSHVAKADGIQLLGIGEMGIGNTTSASAITAVMTNRSVSQVTGRGTGIDDEILKKKISVIKKALEINRPRKSDPIDILTKVGGAEIGAMTGVVLGAALNRIAVVSDGFIATAAAALAVALCPAVRDYLFLAHLSQEPGHIALVDCIGHKPILRLGMRLGEGTGVALAMHIIEGASKLLSEMATFDDAGVSKKGTKPKAKKSNTSS